MRSREGGVTVTGLSICLPGDLPCETLGVFGAGLLGVLAAGQLPT